jgi:predicted transcriptional regulator
MQVTGRVFISVNGKRLRSKEGASLNIGGVSREAQVGDDSVHGYSEKLTAPSVDCSTSHTADTSLKELQAITDATLVFETDTGKTYTLSHAWLSGQPELSKGEVKLKFEAMNCEES